MIEGNKVLAVIPARGGSKGVPGKNIRMLCGKPLIAWTIEAARASRLIDRVVVSTDDPRIAEAAVAWGAEVPFTRPASLAGDETPGIAPLRHAVETLPGFELVALLQPTSPLRTAADIDGCIALAVKSDRPVASVTESSKHPAWMFTLEGELMSPVLPHLSQASRRQDLPRVYALNGAVYVIKTSDLASGQPLVSAGTSAYIMPPARSVDIDTEVDLDIASIHLRGEYR